MALETLKTIGLVLGCCVNEQVPPKVGKTQIFMDEVRCRERGRRIFFQSVPPVSH
jgi:hypothetical protein